MRVDKGQEPTARKVALLAAIVAVTIVISLCVWEFALREYLASTGEGEQEYSIIIWQGDYMVGQVSMSELRALPTVSYEDILGSGAIEEGPLLKDVILTRIDESALSNETTVLIKSDLTLEERTISWGELSNTSRSYILDFTNRGTTKFTSPETKKKDRVRDVTDIRIGV
ncbi:MAG: hypothetical protein ACE5KV_02735 [Thermoplasmata archaeon]